MKRYVKDGQIKTRQQIVIRKDGMNTYNPTEEMILADGWEEYVVPVYEPTEEEILNREKEYKIEEILRHDSSREVNCFYIADQEMWLDKATRVGLKLRFDTELEDGDTETTLWFDGVAYPLELEVAVKMLHAIEKYASKCYDNTQMHIGMVNSLTTVEDIKNYDYRTGYPEKLRF